MKCPIDDAALQITERQGIEIDYCPQCRGVWLDRGEMDKIIERSASWGGGAPDDRRGRDDDRRPRDDRYDGRKRRKKPSSFLEALMDFD